MSRKGEGSSHRKRYGESSGNRQVSKRLRPQVVQSKGIDRISALPEDLIVHILSLLPTRDNIRTGALSRRWQYLWTQVPNLYIRSRRIYGDPDVVKQIYKTLTLFGSQSKVKSFGVACDYHTDYSSDVDSWTLFAECHGVEEFELNLCPFKEGCYYKLPGLLYKNSSFTELNFSYCSFHNATRRKVSWSCLTNLTIFDGELNNEALGKILAGAPVLEFLSLTFVNPTDKTLCIGHSHLKILFVDVTEVVDVNHPVIPELEVSAPKLGLLMVSGYFVMFKFDMNSLVFATLFGPQDDSIEYQCVTNREVVYSLLDIRSLTLDTWIIQGIAKLMADDVRPSVSKCKCLTLDTYLETDPIAIARLLQSTPEIETLNVTTVESDDKDSYSMSDISDIYQFWKSQEMASTYLKHLRTVTFDRFTSHYGIFAFSFVQFVLRNARRLEEMVINLTGSRNPNASPTKESYKTSKKILRFHRSSPDAQVLVYP